MKIEHEGGAGVPLPTPEEPLPEFLGKPGLQQLRRLISESWRSDRPRLAAEQEAMVRGMADALARALVPARPAEIGLKLEALMWHYPPRDRSPEAAASVAADWIRDLGHLPEDIVDAACSGWRRGQNAYAPSPGHLLALADPILAARRQLHALSLRLISPAVPVNAVPGGR